MQNASALPHRNALRPALLWAAVCLILLGVLLVVIFGVWGTNYDAQAFIYFQF